MNKLIIALSLACASAYVFADTIVGATPKTTKADWFNATAGSTIEGGEFTSGAVTVEGDKYVIDSELAEPVTFKADTFTDGAKDMVEVAINLDTSIVPSDVRKESDLSDKNAKVAFAASEDDDVRAYYAWVGSWKKLSGATPGADGTPYNLFVTFDNREETKKVQFKVGSTILKDDTTASEWLPYSPVVSTTMSIDLVGSGNVASLIGSQLTVTAEVIDVDGGTIDIKEEDMAAFKKALPAGYDTVDKFIAEDAQKAFGSANFKAMGITVGAAYALGLVEKINGTDGEKMAPKDSGELKAHAIAESTTAGIKIGLNVTPRPDTGATIAFKVVDEKSTEVEGVTIDQNFNILIPSGKLAKGLKTYKVQAVVTPKAK